jgi:hypothetical protein
VNPETHVLTYAMGWNVQDHRGEQLIAHAGALNSFRTQVALLPKRNIGMVVLLNAGRGWAGFAIRNAIIDLMLDGKPSLRLEHVPPEPRPNPSRRRKRKKPSASQARSEHDADASSRSTPATTRAGRTARWGSHSPAMASCSVDAHQSAAHALPLRRLRRRGRKSTRSRDGDVRWMTREERSWG